MMMSLLSELDLENFREQGFLCIPDVYAAGEMMATRDLFHQAFAEKNFHQDCYDTNTLLTDIYTHFPGLEALVFNEKQHEVAKALLGATATLIPECAVHRERYIYWHKDTTVQELQGITTHNNPVDGPILQFAIYFQDNGVNGGGLTVIPGTHLMPDPFLSLYSNKLIKKIWNKSLKIMGLSIFDKMDKHPDKFDIPSRLGDLVVFDLRIFHRATFRSKSATFEKFAVFNTYVNPTGAGMDYFQFMKQRQEPYYQYFRDRPLSDSVKLRAKELDINILY